MVEALLRSFLCLLWGIAVAFPCWGGLGLSCFESVAGVGGNEVDRVDRIFGQLYGLL